MTRGGYGLEPSPALLPLLEKLAKVLYVAAAFTISTTATAKLSILCLYRRVFSTSSFRRNSLVVGLMVVAYWLAAVLGTILKCLPIDANWKSRVQISGGVSCINFAALFLGLELANCVLDIVIICLPWRVIRHLQMPTRQKYQLAFIFFLGGL